MSKKLTLKKAMERAQVNRAILSQDSEIEERRLHHIIEGTVEPTPAERQFIADVLGLHIDDIAWPEIKEPADQETDQDKPKDAPEASSRQNFLEGIMNRLQGTRDRKTLQN
jgi:hypothetical protein